MVNNLEVSTYERILGNLEDRAQKVISGKVNCIPSPFVRFRDDFPGVEQGMYYLITANSKVGKTKITDYLFVYNSVDYAFKNPDKVRLKIFYFTLEMSADEKYRQFISYMLYIKSGGKIKISPKNLKSVDPTKVLKPEILELLKQPEYKEYFDFFDSHVVFISDIRNATGIYKVCREYAINNGTTYYRKQKITNRETGKVEEIDAFDYYKQDDEDEYRIVITDHIALLSPESGMTLYDSISKLSSDYDVKLRNNYNFIIGNVQQQAAATESLESFKFNKLKPSLGNLGDNKLTGRDANIILGLYAPYRHEIASYCGYDITKFKDKIRFLELIVDRDGESNIVTPLLFEGAVTYFTELPLPSDTQGMDKVYKYLNNTTSGVSLMISQINYKRRKNGKSIGTGRQWFWENIQHRLYSRIETYRTKSKRDIYY